MSSSGLSPGLKAALILAAVVGGVAYSGFLIDLAASPTSAQMSTIVSDLEVPGQRFSPVLRTLDVVSGVLTLVLMPFLWRALPAVRTRWIAVWSLSVFGAFGALSGIISLPCSDTCGDPAQDVQRTIHDTLSTLSTLGLFVGAGAVALAVRHVGPRWLEWAGWGVLLIGAVTGILFVAGDYWHLELTTGITQRVQILSATAWVILIGVYVVREHDTGDAPVRTSPPG